MSKNIFNNSLIIGLGLIGGSFAKSIKKHELSNEIFAYDINEEAISAALEQKVIDGITDLDSDLKKFDLIVIASPLSSYKEILSKLAKTTSPQAVIIDLGSLKSFIKEILPKNLADNFIACHPIAGTEKSGFEGADSELFLGKKFIICNKNNLSKKIENLAVTIGSNVEFMDTKNHDEIYALTSHLPQFLSFLTKEFSPIKINDEFFKKAFRLDNSPPEIWEEIFKLNAKNLEKFYVKFFENLVDEIELLDENKIKFEHKISTSSKFNEEFFSENFAAIFFRALIVKSYLEIPQIKNYQDFAGTGFKDFTSIAEVLSYDENKLKNLIEKNRSKILKIFNSIS